jgi:hypothetical protein
MPPAARSLSLSEPRPERRPNHPPIMSDHGLFVDSAERQSGYLVVGGFEGTVSTFNPQTA